METVQLTIDGMSCGHCLKAVRQALDALPAIEVRHLELGRAEVGYDPEQSDPQRIAAAIEAAGYDVTIGTAPVQEPGT